MRVVIAVHSWSYGTPQAFRDYLLKRGNEVLFIEHPLFAPKIVWVWGFFETLYKVLKSGGTYDLYLGADCFKSFAGWILKKLGKVKKVYYLTVDYSPTKFQGSIFHDIYFWFDYFCVRHVDRVWNSSTYERDLMAEERQKRGFHPKWRAKQFPLPEGTVERKFRSLSEIRNPTTVVFVGHLKEGLGVELLIDAFLEIPKWHLLIIGDGPSRKKLEAKSNDRVSFIGKLDMNQILQTMEQCAFAVAPYEPETISQYTDSGKVKNYLSCGLPVIITKVPHIWQEIEKESAGIAIDYDKNELKKALLRLMNDPYVLELYRRNAYGLAKRYRWEKIFERGMGDAKKM